MAFTLAPMTELDAVNMMLISIGQTPLNTLAVSGIRDAAIAQTILQNTAREVQNRGWYFNSETDYEVSPDGSGNVVVPVTAFHYDPVRASHNYVPRDNGGTMMLYDLTDKTFTITEDPLKVDVKWFFDFDQIPQSARNYIAVKAARRFQAYMVGSKILHEYTNQDEVEALTELQRADMRTRDINILRDGDYTNMIFQRRTNQLQ